MNRSHTSSRHRPRGLEILHEDRDLFVVNKAPGVLTTGTRRDEAFTAENVLNQYVRKGCARSRKQVYLVHRLDRETSGVLLFAKTEEARQRLKENWKATEKLYLAIVRGHLPQRQGIFSSYLAENEDLYVYSVDDPAAGKLSQTEYAVIKETAALSAVKDPPSGPVPKNQIRVAALPRRGILSPAIPNTARTDPSARALCLHAKTVALIIRTRPPALRSHAIPEVFARLVRCRTRDWDAA
jgi:tRNA pseudouridine32 synthase/23S rRNA pseudouridine746 synthase/23S rRNA pseudouridine1911/1915/1917 synthase